MLLLCDWNLYNLGIVGIWMMCVNIYIYLFYPESKCQVWGNKRIIYNTNHANSPCLMLPLKAIWGQMNSTHTKDIYTSGEEPKLWIWELMWGLVLSCFPAFLRGEKSFSLMLLNSLQEVPSCYNLWNINEQFLGLSLFEMWAHLFSGEINL